MALPRPLRSPTHPTVPNGLSATSVWFWNTPRDGDFPLPGQLCHAPFGHCSFIYEGFHWVFENVCIELEEQHYSKEKYRRIFSTPLLLNFYLHLFQRGQLLLPCISSLLHLNLSRHCSVRIKSLIWLQMHTAITSNHHHLYQYKCMKIVRSTKPLMYALI